MNECGVCKSKIKSLLYCNGCFQRAKSVAERRGRVEELKKLKEEVYFIGNENWLSTDWHEGRKECLKLIERRLLELEKRELK